MHSYVVAIDAFGGGYVIPMIDAFGDMKRTYGFHSVEVASVTDVFLASSGIRGVQLKPTAARKNTSHQMASSDTVASENISKLMHTKGWA